MAAIGSLCAQQLLEPDHGIAELQYLQDENGADGAVVGKVVREIKAIVPGNSEVLIPLGEFKYGQMHKLVISTYGNSGNSSGELTFSQTYGNSRPYVLSEKKTTIQNRYKILYYKGMGAWIGMVLSYKNESGLDNPVVVTYDAPTEVSWYYSNPNQVAIDSLQPVQAKLHIAEGFNYNDGYSENPGVYVDGSPVLTDASGLAYLDTHVSGNYLPISANNQGSSDSLLLEGQYGGSGAIPAQGAGTRMMWYPEKAAFRAGRVNGDQWDASKVGIYSVAMGLDNVAAGRYTAVFGWKNQSYGSDTLVAGANNVLHANNTFSVGRNNTTNGYCAQTLGWSNDAYGKYSTAMGYNCHTNATLSFARGDQLIANSFGTNALGVWNEGRGTEAGKSRWQADSANTVLEVGIGTSKNDRKNALTVLQDGSVELGKNTSNDSIPLKVSSDGSVTLAESQGDISMGIYGAQQ